MPTALVTGANRGIGLSLATQLGEAGYSVIGTARGEAPALAATGARVLPLEVTSAESVAALVSTLDGQPIDLLLCNAGILRRGSLAPLDAESIEEQFAVNALGPLRLVAALRANLHKGAKVGLITSRMGSMADNTSGGGYGYRMSKAALNMAGISLSHDLRADGVSVALLHPGWVTTEMTGNTGNWGPDEAAAGLLARMDELTLPTSGGFWHANGEPLPW